MALRDRDDAAGYTELISFRFVDAINRNVMDIVFFPSINKHLSSIYGAWCWEYRSIR